jgi:hypothetical protein
MGSQERAKEPPRHNPAMSIYRSQGSKGARGNGGRDESGIQKAPGLATRRYQTRGGSHWQTKSERNKLYSGQSWRLSRAAKWVRNQPTASRAKIGAAYRARRAVGGRCGAALCRAAIRSGRSGCWGSELSLDILHRYREAICGLMARQATFPPLRL